MIGRAFLPFGRPFLLLCLLVTMATLSLSQVDLKIDLTVNEDSEGACARLRTGQTRILASGHLARVFLLLTSDFYLYKLDNSETDPSSAFNLLAKPPFRLLIASQPTHLSELLPKAFAALSPIADSLLYGFVSSGNAEYLIFVYKPKEPKKAGDACLLGVTLHDDTVVKGPCGPLPGEITLLSRAETFYVLPYVNSSASPPEYSATSVVFLFAKGPPLLSLEMFADLSKMTSSGALVPCFNLESCKTFTLLPNMAPGTGETITGDGQLVSGYLDKAGQVTLFDDQAMVHYTTGGLGASGFVRARLEDFLGCYETMPRRFDAQTVTLIVAVAVTLQLSICIALFVAVRCLFSGDGDGPEDDAEAKGGKRNSARKTRKSASRTSPGSSLASTSRRLSLSRTSLSRKSSKSRASRSRADDGGASKSRASRSRLSRSVSKRRGSQLGGATLSRGSEKSKSRSSVSRSRASQSRDN